MSFSRRNCFHVLTQVAALSSTLRHPDSKDVTWLVDCLKGERSKYMKDKDMKGLADSEGWVKKPKKLLNFKGLFT
jgi:hypothetical protein